MGTGAGMQPCGGARAGEARGRGARVDDVAERFGHLLAVGPVDEPVGEDGARQRHAGGEEEGGPDHAMKPDDVLADHVEVARPEPRVRAVGVVDAREVVRQRVEPDVHHVVGVARHGDPPRERRARHREVAQRLFLEARDHLVPPDVGHHELGVRGDVVEDLLLELPHAEEVARLLHPLERLPRRRVLEVARRRVGLGDERLLAYVVPPRVRAEVHLAVVDRPLPDLLAERLVPRRRRPHVAATRAAAAARQRELRQKCARQNCARKLRGGERTACSRRRASCSAPGTAPRACRRARSARPPPPPPCRRSSGRARRRQ